MVQTKEQKAAYFKRYYQAHREQRRAATRAWNARIRAKVLAHYGGVCKCCGEGRQEFMTLDHINNDGAAHRKELNSRGGSTFYHWVAKNGFPDDLQLLCWNCNCSKQYFGRCPHEDE